MLDIAIMERVAATTKRLEKLALLREMRETCPGAARALHLAYDFSRVFYVTADEDAQTERWCPMDIHMAAADIWWDRLYVLLETLARRELTGNSALAALDGLLGTAPSRADVRWACRVVNRDLCAGINVSTVNAVWPGLITEFEVALAKAYDPDRHDLSSGSWIYDAKMDGNRVVIEHGVALSRNGRVYSSFPAIVRELEELSSRYLVDGEMMTSSRFDASSGKLRRKGLEALDAYLNVFDLVPMAEWKSRRFTTPLRERKSALLTELGDTGTTGPVRTVPWYDLTGRETHADLLAKRDALMSLGFEGIMLKDLDAPYTPGRSDGLLKLKRFDTYDGRVADVQEHRKQKGNLGALLVEVDGRVCKCGSGFTKEERARLWAERAQLVGRCVEMEAQEKTPDGALRFPKFVRFRPDKD